MKYVIPGGSGVVGQGLSAALRKNGHDVTIISRNPEGNAVQWDGQTLGDWASCIDGADVVVNLAGRSVNCRYTKKNLKQMMDSRLNSTRVVGEAIALYRRARRAGVTVRSSADCLIAACAIRHDLTVLHVDRDFTQLARISHLSERRVTLPR